MSTITLPNIRVGSDLQVRVRLKDNGVAIDWSTLQNIKACIYSDAQRALAGRCAFSIDEEDSTLLVCTYAANKPQYLGVNRIVISAKYMGETKTYDKPAFSFVRWTADQDGEQITIDDPDVDVEIDVADVSSSLLDEAIRAAFTAAEEAVDAKGQVLETEAEVEAAEALRVSAEESRVEAEEGRAEAEAARVDEEAVRVSAEDARVVAENARAAAEDLREGAEDDRAAAETARETAEAARVAAEALRVTAEGSRETAEAAREAQASADHTVAAGDHTQAAADHTQAAADHTTAASDHTQAGADHTLAAADHVTAGEDHAQAQDDHEVMEGYDTRLGSVESEVSQLEAEVTDLFADSPAELDIADEDGNVVARFKGGNIKLKNFDSSETTKTANGAAGDLDICDESGNIVARFKDGNIKTKNFDSSRFQQTDDICDFIENSFHTGRFKFDRVTIWDYYAAYDELCDFRQILVKESPIGFSTLPSDDRATKDANQYPINLYRIQNNSARKRIVLMGAIHGDSQFTDANPTGEDWYGDHGDAQENILAPYYFVCDLIRHKDDNPEYKLLLQEYEIDIIPILNPWGVQNHSRRNGNNVDLNRNFDATDSQGNSRWQNQTQGNKGASPFSENETQAIVSYINAHNDIHLVVECHARGEVNLGGDNRFYAVCPDGVPCRQGITDAVNAAKAKFGAQGGLHPYTRDEVPATCYAWIFFEKGIPTFEPELGQSIGRRFFFNVKMSTAKRLNINDVYTITTTVPDFVVTFRVVASDGSDEAMVLGDTYALLYNGTYRCGNDTITIASNTVMDAPSRHCKELLYSMFWYYRKLVFETL